MSQPWEDAEIHKLLVLRHDEKRSFRYIAKVLDRSNSACKNKFDEVMRDFEREEKAEDLAA